MQRRLSASFTSAAAQFDDDECSITANQRSSPSLGGLGYHQTSISEGGRDAKMLTSVPLSPFSRLTRGQTRIYAVQVPCSHCGNHLMWESPDAPVPPPLRLKRPWSCEVKLEEQNGGGAPGGSESTGLSRETAFPGSRLLLRIRRSWKPAALRKVNPLLWAYSSGTGGIANDRG